MRFHTALFAFSLLIPSGYAVEPQTSPDVLSRITQIFHRSDSPVVQEGVNKNFSLKMEVSPIPLKLSDTRQLKVVISLTNRSKNTLRLDFSNTQRFEILVKDHSDHLLLRWSEDQSFQTESALVVINPGERVEYEASVATRDLSVGNEYLIEGFFPKFSDLKIQKKIVPQ